MQTEIYNLITKQLLQAYIEYTEHLLKKPHESLSHHLQQKLNFYFKQYQDALAPNNFAHLNPSVIEKIIASDGVNLLQGMRKFEHDLKQGKNLFTQDLSDHQAFELGKNIACTPGSVIFQNEVFQLIYYTPSNKKLYQTPVLFIPPWINKYYILDLQPENSLVKWLIEKQHHVFMISWINPTKNQQNFTFTDYLIKGAFQALSIVEKLCQQKMNVVGYCIGGTLLACLLSFLAKKNINVVQSATFLTTLLDFKNPGELGVFIDEKQIEELESAMQSKGFLSGKILASVFNCLRANDLIWHAFVNQYLKNEKPKPFDLLYWNDDSTNVAANLHAFYLRNMYLQNRLIKQNSLRFNNIPIDLQAIKTPCYFLAAHDDHIIPWASSYESFLHLTSAKRFVLTHSGHVAGVINHPDKQKYAYKTLEKTAQNAQDFLQQANQHAGSWWVDWHMWLHAHSGNMSDQYQIKITNPLEKAPGSYVKVRIEH